MINKRGFDYLDYKNRIPLDKCLVEIPRLNPLSIRYQKFWIHTIKKKQIEGHWVEHNKEWKWIPGPVFHYCNLGRIERKSASGGAKGKVIGIPDLRDLEWIKGYVHAVARGFSGFSNDDEYSCHRILNNPDREELIPFLPQKIQESLYNSNNKLKKYRDPLPYLYEYYDRNLGKPYYYNEAKNVLEIGARNYGKDLEENTLLHGEHGLFPIKDVKKGDRIYDDSGKLTTVLDRIDFNDQVQYEITLQDGRKILCGKGHKWGVYHRTKYKVVDLDYIMSTKYKSKRSNGYWEYAFRLPLTKPVDYTEKEFILDPYLLGCWLGDGHSGVFSITTADKEIADEFINYAEENNWRVRKRGYTYHIENKRLDNPTNILRRLNLIQNKHIPEEYLFGSIEQRLSLLQGLMDTDGTIGFKGYCTFDNTNYTLIKDVERLCWSLGIKTKLKTKPTTWVHKGIRKRSFSYRLFINTDLSIFRLTRKLDKMEINKSAKSISSARSSAIVDIKEVGIRPSVCIKVDNESHLFLAGDYIVTHNSLWSANICIHNFLTDGATDFDEWYEEHRKPKGDATKIVYTTQTLIGAIDAKYVNNLTKHIKVGLDNLPGSYKVGDTLYPPPLSKQYMGSFTVGKDITARYQEKSGGQWEWKGTGSGFSMRSFKDNPYAANGLRYGLGLIDEIGFHNNLLDTLGQLHECTTVDGEKYGTIWGCGTGGDMESGATVQAMKVFYDGEAYDCITFDDIFEDKGKIGLFIPAWMTLSEYRDEYGNINKELALKKLLKEREVAKNAKSKEALYSLLQMKPLVPSEAFLVLDGNIFPVAELREHMAFLESSEKTKDLGNNGWMVRDSSGKAYFKVDHELKPADYPTRDSVDDKGAVVVWEEPIENPPYGLYVLGVDPYDQDAAENSVSFGSVFVYKRFIGKEGETVHLPVAEYTGRPQFANDFYEQVRRLAEWYNGKILYENQNPGLKKYFDTKFSTYLLHSQPNIIKQISPNSNVNRQYGIHMTKQIKDELEIMTRDWLKTELEPGVMQLTKINSIPLLKELIAYNSEGNFDRFISFALCILQDVEMHRIKVQEVKEESSMESFFNRKLFLNGSQRKRGTNTFTEFVEDYNKNLEN